MQTKIGFIVVCASVLLASAAGSAAHCLRYLPSKVSVTGTVFERTDWGPPNYREDPAHDRPEPHDYIRLDTPLCVFGVPGDAPDDITEKNVSIMELAWDSEEWPIPNVVGRHVLLTGGLFHAISGHHHTRVLLMVSRVRAVTVTEGKAK
jgi:hypothetical protein